MLFLSASKIAQLIGEHKYKSREQSLYEFWKANDTDQYKLVVSEVSDERPLESVVKQAIAASDILADINIATNQCSPEITKEAVRSVTTKVQESLESIKGISDQRKTDAAQQAYDAVRSMIHMQQGVLHETTGMNTFEDVSTRSFTKRNSKFYGKTLKTSKGKFYKIGGRCDGIDETSNIIIEHKHRVHYLFEEMPKYERIQLVIYMYLTGVKRAELIQHCGGAVESLALIEWDDEEWKLLKSKCDSFIDDYSVFMGDTDRQVALIYAIENYE